MPGPGAIPVELPEDVRSQLSVLVRSPTAPAGLSRRARIALLADEGVSSSEIARRVGVDPKTVRLWRARVAEDPSLDALLDRPRSGRPPVIRPEVRAKVISLACDRPKDCKVPFRQLWTRGSLSDAVAEATGVRLSVAEIGRILVARELRPHRVRPWLHCQDPLFDQKIRPICDLYVAPPDDVTVLCVDEKRLFARKRPRELQPAAPGRAARAEFEYSRHGSSVLLAAFDIKTGRVIAECRDRRTGDDLVAFMEKVAAMVPGKVVVIWDNLNVHYDGKSRRWTRFNARHDGRFDFVYTPKHASWTNQIEIWFSILHRRVLLHGSFGSVVLVNAEVLAFTRHWNTNEAHGFHWTFRGTTKPQGRGFTRARTRHRALDRRRTPAEAA